VYVRTKWKQSVAVHESLFHGQDLGVIDHGQGIEGQDWHNVLKDMAPDQKPVASSARKVDKEPRLKP